jgi:multidrug efflux system membrane fusion protein
MNYPQYPARPKRRKWLLPGLVVGLLAGVSYYAFGSSDAQTQPGEAQAVPVGVRTLQAEPVRIWTSYSGRLHPVDAAEIRPEVNGRIVKVNFTDGQPVKQGQVLFVIDPGPYEAAAAQAEAALATAKSNAQFAAMEQKRAAAMMKTDAIARRLYDERATANHVSAAAVKAAEAALKQARIDLDRAHVKAPIGGRAGRVELTVGNVVQAGAGAPLLTTIVANDAIYADFEVDEQHYLQAIRRAAHGRADERKIPVKLTVNGDDHAYEGSIYSFDNQLNAGSGTIRARARFANQNGDLLPGMFATVSLANAESTEAVRVPEQAIGFDQSKKYVYTVGSDNTTEYREVTLGEAAGGERIVVGGLSAGDRVIVEGVQHVRPGAPVAPKEAADSQTLADAKGPQS